MGVNTFITSTKDYALCNPGYQSYVYFPFRDCKKSKAFGNIEHILCHLIIRGFVKDFTIWSKHGKVGDNVRQETLDYVTMPDVARLGNFCD